MAHRGSGKSDFGKHCGKVILNWWFAIRKMLQSCYAGMNLLRGFEFTKGLRRLEAIKTVPPPRLAIFL